MIGELLYTFLDWLNQIPHFWWWLVFTLVKIGAGIGILLGMVAYTVVLERRVASFIQDRLGPNRSGPWGLLQPACDGIKAFLKEDFIPGGVHRFFYWLAPAALMVPAMMTLAVIPFGSNIGAQPMVIADQCRPALHLCRRLDVRLRHRPGRLRSQLQIPLYRRNACQRPDDFL
jgi:NADH-quinone oxidoreductase subunit H